jgi:ferredoxin--NADP+ reductase
MAQALRREWQDAEITLIERLPVPYGLVRYGVAPDHPGTKAVTRQFERMFEREKIQFLGNVHVGTELPLADLRAAYDIVVVATGLYGDRKLGVPGDALNHIYGAGQITRFLNDHPDEEGFSPSFGTRPIIVGNGNVAIDVLRLLVKKGQEFHGSDLSHEALAHLASSPIEHIDVVGRSAAAFAKFDTVMIKELAKLAHVQFEFNDELGLESIDDPLARAKGGSAARTDSIGWRVWRNQTFGHLPLWMDARSRRRGRPRCRPGASRHAKPRAPAQYSCDKHYHGDWI